MSCWLFVEKPLSEAVFRLETLLLLNTRWQFAVSSSIAYVEVRDKPDIVCSSKTAEKNVVFPSLPLADLFFTWLTELKRGMALRKTGFQAGYLLVLPGEALFAR